MIGSHSNTVKFYLKHFMKYYNSFNSPSKLIGFALLIMLIPQLLIFSSCKKLVEVEAPVTAINASNVYENDATASAVLLGIYTNLGGLLNGTTGISIQNGLSADELTLWSGSTETEYLAFYKNTLDDRSNLNWSGFYYYLLQANSAIEGLNNSNGLTPSLKMQLIGEAMFIRAFIYFYLLNLYGDVPLIITSDYRVNSTLARSEKNVVLQQVISDLKDAQTLLSENYVGANVLVSTNERTRPNKWAATALLARSYLYNGNLTGEASNYTNAEAQATLLINNTTLYDTVSLNNGVFNKNSKETIWQLQPVNTGRNTEDGVTFILQNSPNSTQPFYLSKSLLGSFEMNDKRFTNWVGKKIVNTDTFYFPFKYKVYQSGSLTEYVMILRLAEQYLIRTEARAQQSKITESKNDLNVIRTRAGLPNTSANDKTSLLAAILHERQIEFFTELGHRWLDLKRTSNADAVMGIIAPQKGGTWETTDQLYPIPVDDIQKNPALIQNPGY